MTAVPRKTFLVPVLLLLAINSFAQRKNVVKANVLSPFIRTANLSYERVTKIPADSSRVQSFQVTGFYSNNNQELPLIEGYGTVVEYRWYEKNATQAKGTYLSAYARYQHFTRTYAPQYYSNGQRSDFNAGGVGVLFGEQWIMAKVIVLDVFVGTGYDIRRNENWNTSSTSSALPHFPDWNRMYDNRFAFRFGVRIGLAF